MSEIADRYRDLSAEFTRRVAAVPDGRWDDPSPCEDWTARDVLRHVVDTQASTPSYAGIEIKLERSVDDDPEGAWDEARDAMQDLLDDPVQAGTTYEGMFGETKLEKTVDTFIGLDLVVHAWDIARATGQDETMPPADVHQLFGRVKDMGDMLRTNGVCGPEVEVAADAPEQDRLLGLLGRTP
jgi:uncharacterized protein (TIGR03086 family)